MLPMEYKGALGMERPATDWMDKRRQAAPQLAAFIQASGFFTLHSSLKEYRILHSPLFTLHLT